jgi:hypothetical protein
LRILRDIGALVKKDKVWMTSALGKQFMEAADE